MASRSSGQPCWSEYMTDFPSGSQLECSRFFFFFFSTPIFEREKKLITSSLAAQMCGL